MKKLFSSGNWNYKFALAANIIFAGLFIFITIHGMGHKSKSDRSALVLNIEIESKKPQKLESEGESLADSDQNFEEDALEEELAVIDFKDDAEIAASPKISILITNLGLNKLATDLAIALPAEVSLGFSPYSLNLEEYAKAALENGHDIFLNLPMEPINYPKDDPGSLGLLTNLSPEQNRTRLSKVLKKLDNFNGLYTSDSEKFTLSEKALAPIIETIKDKGLLLLYSGRDSSVIDKLTNELSYSIYYSDAVLDHEITPESIDQKLTSLEELAVQNGAIIALGNSYPITINRVNEWTKLLGNKDVLLIPVSELIKQYGK